MDVVDQLKKGDNLPTLCLLATTGEEVRLNAWRGLRNLVLFVTHPLECVACEELLLELEDNLGRLQGEEAEVVVAVPGRLAEVRQLKQRLELSFPVFIDTDSILGNRPILVVTDRFGEIYSIARAGDDHQFPTVEKIVEELAFIGVQCPE